MMRFLNSCRRRGRISKSVLCYNLLDTHHPHQVEPEKEGKYMAQYSYMKAPDPEYSYEVGDIVEVFCDHEKANQRIRGWLKGIVVQVDAKMVAVQFRSNVFLTDGWMVPDHILWFPVNSQHIRFPERKTSRSSMAHNDDY